MKTSTTKTIATALLALGLSAGAAFAQGVVPDFASVDADQSGGVSLAEAQVYWTTLTAEQFTSIDVDGSGDLSADEFASLAAATTTGQ